MTEQEFLSPVATAMLANSDGGSVVVALVVEVEGGAAEVLLLAGRGEITEVVVVLVALVVVVGVLSLLVAQAVAVSAAMARTDTLRRCLIKIARAILMPSDNSTHQATGQGWTDWQARLAEAG